MTITEEYRKYESEADELLNQILEEKMRFLPEERTHVYAFYSQHPPRINIWEVEGFHLSELSRLSRNLPKRPHIEKRADKKKVEQMKAYLDAIKAHADAFTLYIYCKNGQNYLTSFNYERDFKEKQIAAFSMEELQPKVDALQKVYDENYAPREGYTPCAYCGKQTSNDKLVKRDIYTYGGVPVTKYFCSAECAINEQMAHEG